MSLAGTWSATPFSGWRRAAAPLQGPVLVALAYFAGAEAAFYIGTLSDQIFALFWPPNVILFCALVVVPQRSWWRYLVAAFPAHVAAELGVGMPAAQLLVAFATNCSVALFNAYAVRLLVGGPPWFGNWRKAFRYIVITVGAGPALAAFGGAFVPILGGGALDQYWIFWSHWYLANVLPNLTIGPVFLIWFSDGARWVRWNPSRRHLEPAVLAVMLIGMCVVAAYLSDRLAGSGLGLTVLLFPLPLIMWAAIRFGEKGASLAILTVAVIMTWRTLHHPGPFVDESPERNVLALQIFLTGLAIPVLLLGALIDELQRTERTARDLAASLVRAQDEERRRIARDLHDSTGQNLIAATLIAGRLEPALPEAARPAFQQLEDVLQQSIREVRTVSYLLHPPLLDEAGLDLAIRNFVEGFSERSGIAVDLEIAPDEQRLPADVELTLFRVVQEALINVARHSGSATARIRLAREPIDGEDAMVLTVEDEGRGMPAVRRKRGNGCHNGTGVGLAGMRERLHQVDGQLEIESAAGHTLIRATVPV